MFGQKKRIKRLQGSSYVVSLEPQDVLGQGSFGKVVRAFDMEHKGEQLVAKIIEINSQSKIESLKMELKVLEAFQGEHQNLVGFKRLRLFSKKCYYIIMEYCNGGTLEEKIARSKKLSEIEIIDFLGQFCSGYRELLRQGIIHRDIKPANIMIHNRIYKIADFGLAKVVETLFQRLNLSVKGTPLYMAPELIKEEAVADPKVDMWSLGIVLYRMLFGGQFPFLNPNKKYGNREQAFNDILQSPLNIPKHPRRSHDLVELVSRMLEKDPNVRISWEELFLHPLININESKPQESKENHQMMNSQLFVQQFVFHKESQIKVQPFLNTAQKKDQFKGILGGISKVITEEDLTQSQMEEKKEKEVLEDIMKDLNNQLVGQKIINSIEDAILFNREQVYFLDKVALRISCIDRVVQKPDLAFCYSTAQIAIFLLQMAQDITNQLINLVQIKNSFPPDQIRVFKLSENWNILSSMIQKDKVGIDDFVKELTTKSLRLSEQSSRLHHSSLPDAAKVFFQKLRDVETIEKSQLKQLYICATYLTKIIRFGEFVNQFGGTMEEFWRFYELVEDTTEEELQEYAIERMFDEIDALRL